MATQEFDLTGRFYTVSDKYMLDQSLHNIEMQLLAIIEGFSRNDGKCFASNAYFAKMLHIKSMSTIDSHLKTLEKKKYIVRETQGKDRCIKLLDSQIDHYMRNDYVRNEHPQAEETASIDNDMNTNFGITDEDMNTKNVFNAEDTNTEIVLDDSMNTNFGIDEYKNCTQRIQNSDAIYIGDKDSIYIPNRNEIYGNNILSNIGREHTEDDDIEDEGWKTFLSAAYKMRLPVMLKNAINKKHEDQTVKLKLQDVMKAVRDERHFKETLIKAGYFLSYVI